MDKASFLRGVSVFSGLDEKDIAAVAQMVRERRCKKGETLFRTGEQSDAFYLIAEGRLQVGLEDGKQRVHYYWLRRGEAAGIVSFFGRSEHRTTARAAEDTMVLVVGKDSLPQLRQMPELLLSMFRERMARMRMLVEKEEDLSSLSQDEIWQGADSLRRLLEELEDRSIALHNEIHGAQIKLQLYEAQLGCEHKQAHEHRPWGSA